MNFYKKSKRSYKKTFIHSVGVALAGVVHALKTERNMRLHFLAGFLVVIAGIYFNFSAVEFMALCFAVTFVLAAEMFNTAIEYTTDLIISDEYHPVVKVIKDIAAGAVFVSAVNATVVGYVLFKRIGRSSLSEAFQIVKNSPWHMTMIALLIVVGAVLFIKIAHREKSLLRGGMPSGHTAVAFAVWVAVSFLTENALVSVLVLLLAVLVGKSRVDSSVHTLWEVIAGGTLGLVVTLLVMQLLS